jgi:hypothetical protein
MARMSGIATVVLILVLLLRVELFSTGSLYTHDETWAADLIVAVLALWTALSWTARAFGRVRWDQRIAIVAGVLALPAAAVGVSRSLAPTTPDPAAAPACLGASVAGGRFRATTPAGGINARSGPDTSYPQDARFAGDCTLSFDGYCVGEPTDDLVVKNDPDQRWLILHRPWRSSLLRWLPWAQSPLRFVAAGKVQSQTAESLLGRAPAKSCAGHGGWQAPGRITTATRGTRAVTINAKASGAQLIGLSLYASPAPAASGNVVPLTSPVPKRTSATGAISADWNAGTVTGPAIGNRAAEIVLMASVCLAPAVPDPDDYALMGFAWNGRHIARSQATGSRLRTPELSRMQTTACRVAPDYPKAAP